MLEDEDFKDWPVGRVNCCWYSPAQSILVSGPVGTHDRNFICAFLECYLFWNGGLFDERRGLTTTGHSPSAGGQLTLLRVGVTLGLAVYRQSARLGAKPLQAHDQSFIFLQLNACVTSSLTRWWVCLIEIYFSFVKCTYRTCNMLSQSQSHVTTHAQSASQSWCQAPSAAQDQIFVTVRQFRFCRCGAPSLTRGRVCYLPRWKSVVHVIYIYNFTYRHSTYSFIKSPPRTMQI
jgi:hypothetical protein